jgi:outer membrane protein assembly factor BamB
MTTNRIHATIPIKALITVVVLFGMGLCLRFSAASLVIFKQTQNKDDSTNGARTSSNDVVTSRANYQRTGFYSARGVHDLKGIIWKTPQLFSLEKKQNPLDDNLIDFDEVFFGEYGVSAPIFANGVVYFSLYVGHGYLAALDASTGRLLWSFKRERGHISDLSIAGNLVYVGIDPRTIVGLDAKTGQEQWRFSGPNPTKPVKGLRLKLFAHVYAPSPVVANQLIIFSTVEGDLYAVDRATKEIKWSFQADGFIGPIALGNGAVYFGTLSGSAYSVDLTSGHENWKIKAKLFKWPLVANGSLYFSDKGSIYAVDAATGQTKWKVKARGKPGTALGFAYYTIYFAGLNDSIYALDANNGQEKWRFKTSDAFEPPVIADGIVYAGGSEQLIAIDAHSGAQIWVLNEKKADMSSPAVGDGVVYALAAEGRVYAIR